MPSGMTASLIEPLTGCSGMTLDGDATVAGSIFPEGILVGGGTDGGDGSGASGGSSQPPSTSATLTCRSGCGMYAFRHWSILTMSSGSILFAAKHPGLKILPNEPHGGDVSNNFRIDRLVQHPRRLLQKLSKGVGPQDRALRLQPQPLRMQRDRPASAIACLGGLSAGFDG